MGPLQWSYLNQFGSTYDHLYMGELQWSNRTNLVRMRPLVDKTIVMVIFEQYGSTKDHCYMGELQWSSWSNLVHMRPLVDKTIIMVM